MEIAQILPNILEGLKLLMSINVWIGVAMGTIIGLLLGCIPGLSAVIGIALFTPFTFFLPPQIGIPFLVGIYKGSSVGSFIPAILIRTPGTNQSTATMLDGYPLAQKGYPNKALQTALASSVSADTMSDLILLFTAPFLGFVAILLGVPERFAIIVCSLALIGAFIGRSPLKGFASAFLGLLLSTIGIDAVTGTNRFIFGNLELSDGVSIIPATLGLFAIAEVMRIVGDQKGQKLFTKKIFKSKEDRLTWHEFKGLFGTILKATGIGSLIGAAPGIGPATAAFVSYGVARKSAKNPDEFGEGSLHGIAAAEAANNAVYGPNLIPLFTLGIPGSLVAAVLYGAFIAQGLHPGPQIFQHSAPIVYMIILALIGSNIIAYLFGKLFMRVASKVLRIPKHILAPGIIIIATAGMFSLRHSWYDVWVMLIFGLIGFAMDRYKFPLVPLIIAMILGRDLETSLIQSLLIFRGNIFGFFSRPIACGFLLLALFVLFWSVIKVEVQKRLKVKKKGSKPVDL